MSAISSFNVGHPSCILKILLYACETVAEPFLFAHVSPDFFDAVEPDGASAVMTKFGITLLPSSFLRRTKNTEVFDSRFLFPIKFIGTACMSWSMSLKTLDFSSSTCFPANVRFVSDSCFVLMSVLEFADLSGFTEVETIGDRFMADCGKLKKCIINFPKVRSIGTNFLSGSTSLESFDVSSLISLEKQTPAWFLNKSGVRKIEHLDKMKRCEIIESGFCSECMSLKSIDLSFISEATTIGPLFCYWCRSLETVFVSEQQHEEEKDSRTFFFNLKKIGYSFFETTALTSMPNDVFLQKLVNVQEIGKGFLQVCNELKSTAPIDLSQMKKLKSETCFQALHDLKKLAAKNHVAIQLPEHLI